MVTDIRYTITTFKGLSVKTMLCKVSHLVNSHSVDRDFADVGTLQM